MTLVNPAGNHLGAGGSRFDACGAKQHFETPERSIRSRGTLKDRINGGRMKEYFGGGLCARHIQSFEHKQVTIAAEVGQESNHREGFMCWFVPVAGVSCSLARPWLCILNERTFHSGTVNNSEVGILLGNRSPRIAADRTNNYSIGTFQIVQPDIAWKADEYALRIV